MNSSEENRDFEMSEINSVYEEITYCYHQWVSEAN